MGIDKEYVEQIRAALSLKARQWEDQYRTETLTDLHAGYFAEVEHLGKSLFGSQFRVRK